MIRLRLPILFCWIVVIGLLIPAASRLSDRLVASAYLRESESAAVEDELRERFGSARAHTLLLVARGLPSTTAEARDEGIRAFADVVKEVPGVTSIHSWPSTRDSLLLGSEPGSAILLAGVDPGTESPDSLVMRLRRATVPVCDRFDNAVTAKWSGTYALSFDLRHASSHDVRRAEARALPVSLLLLVLAFGSVGAALIPAIFGVLAIVASLGAAALVSEWWTPSVMLRSVVSVLGLALGIDYALISVARFREGLARGLQPSAAAEGSARRAGRVIVLSGSTVALGFMVLFIVPVEEVRSVALGGLLTVSCTVLLATTLLPGVLSWVGHRIDLCRLGRGRTDEKPHPFWNKWGRFVTRHPWRVLVVAGVPVVLLSLPGLRVSTVTPQHDWLPAEMEARQALDDLGAVGRGGLANTITVILELPEGLSALEGEGWAATDSLARWLSRDGRVSRVHSLPTIAARFPVPTSTFLSRLPDPVRAEFATPEGDRARLDVIPEEDVPIVALAGLVRDVRDHSLSSTGLDDAVLRVGGIPAYQVDYEDIVGVALPSVVTWVIVGIFIALAAGFRSVLIPLKATILNLLTVGAAFGALVLVFQDGHGARWFGLDAPLEGVFPAVPVLAFAIVFGLSMDYEVFLVGRVAEARRRPDCPSEADAIVEGLARTGRVITGAAAIMVVVFAAFALSDYLPAKLLGFCLAVAVLVDATLVRLAIGPALLTLAGRWNWWPGGVARGPGGTER